MVIGLVLTAFFVDKLWFISLEVYIIHIKFLSYVDKSKNIVRQMDNYFA